MQVLDIMDLYDGQKIRIGTHYGSCYIWIGTVSENLTIELMEIWKEYKKYFDGRINLFGRRLEAANSLESFYRENPQDFYFQLLEIEEIREKFREAKRQRKACTNFLKREVIEVFPSISELDTTIFIVEGYETGRAWNLTEWEAINDRNAKRDYTVSCQ